jgi:phosphatidylglycerophosphatase A
MRPFSGTWGSIPPVLIALALIAIEMGPVQQPWIYNSALIGVLLFFAGACVVQGDAAEARFGEKDPTNVVADETAGQCLPLLFLPTQTMVEPDRIVFTLLFAFVAFRVFDIVKPWPARQLQAVPGGWGILLDDLFAGLYAAIALQVTARLILTA